ncbi:MAG: alpha/beta hydrolase [Novosphingobium sp.]|nr:alpha/beta hydrolase [Novosphingobium sp.]
MSEFEDRYWSSRDGLRLHYRCYPGRDDRVPLLCLPGLTRNVRDFETLAGRFCGEWQVVCPEMRGRGDSDYAKDSATYNPMQYVEDIAALLEEAAIERFVAIGTSLGGLMTMVMAMTMPGRIAGAVLNDIGPVLEPAGLERIRGYVGQGRNFPTWMHAARAIEEAQSTAYPDYEIADWLGMAKRLMTLSSNGRIVFDYDMKIAEPLNTDEPAAEVDLWPGIEGLSGRPVLFLRGELSDILSEQTLRTMTERLPQAEAVTVPRVGHAPTLDEPECVAAIDRLLARVS